MDRPELLRRISTFPLVAEELADDLMSGDFRSVFKGQGIEFDEVRRYQAGDDARSIDWNVSARFGSPFVKLFREERELTVFVVLDVSASMRSGGGDATRLDQAVLATALIALSAEKAGERVGAVLFSGGIDRVLSPRKGRKHAMAVVDAALSAACAGGAGQGSALGKALEGAARALKRRSLVAVVSDFLCVDWEAPLGLLARRHDVVAVRIHDPVDAAMPNAGLVLMRDPETGIELKAPTSFPSFRAAWDAWHADRAAAWRAACLKRRVACLELSTADDPAASLGRFFGSRRRA